MQSDILTSFYIICFVCVVAFETFGDGSVKEESGTDYEEDFYNRKKRWVDEGLRKMFSHLQETQCYFNIDNDELPSLKEQKVGENSIFFIKTSCKPSLSFREACSVESAARAHPCRPINVIFLGPATGKELDDEPLRTLLKYRNVNIYRLHIDRLVKNKVLESVLLHRVPLESTYALYHTSDIVRFILLNMYGGIYLDLDVIVLRSLDSLPYPRNWLAVEDARSHKIGTSMLAFGKDPIGSTFTGQMLHFFETNYSPKSYTHNSNGAVKKVVETICGSGYMQKLNTNFCKGLAIYDEKYFFPINYKRPYDYFRTEFDMEYFANSFTLHMYNTLTGEKPIKNASMYAAIMRRYCPWMSKKSMVIKIVKTKENRTVTISNKELENMKIKMANRMRMQNL